MSLPLRHLRQPQSVPSSLLLTVEDTPLNLTPEEKRVFGELFRQADTEQMGVVTGEVAVKFFERTKLPPQILGEVRAASIRCRLPRCATPHKHCHLEQMTANWGCAATYRYGRLPTLRTAAF